jgi:flavin-dependent dehydrogenase
MEGGTAGLAIAWRLADCVSVAVIESGRRGYYEQDIMSEEVRQVA